MPSLFGTHPFLILSFITINIIGTILILRQLAVIAAKPFKINYVRFAKRPITTIYNVSKKENTLYFKRTMDNPFFVKSSKNTIQSEDYDNYYLSNHLITPKKAVTERTPS